MSTNKGEKKIRNDLVLVVVNALVERFDDIEEETGADFTHAKRIILRWNKKFQDKAK